MWVVLFKSYWLSVLYSIVIYSLNSFGIIDRFLLYEVSDNFPALSLKNSTINN